MASSLDYRPSDTRIAENGFATSSGVSKSAKVVLVFTHISARVPRPEHHFLINPYGMMFEEITASSLVKVDADGNALGNSPYAVNPAGFTIHSAVHEVREDAGCVIHLQTGHSSSGRFWRVPGSAAKQAGAAARLEE